MKKLTLIIILLVGGSIVSCAQNANVAIEEPIAEIQTPPAQEILTGECDNIFYALQSGNRWVYQLGLPGGGGLTGLTITVGEVSGNRAELLVRSDLTGAETPSTVLCETGAILSFPLTELNAVLGGAIGEIEIEYQSGEFMPSEADFIEGGWMNKWSTQYRATGLLQGHFGGEPLQANFNNSPIKLDWEVVQTGGSLQVAAGTFDNVVQLNRRAEIEVTSLEATLAGNRVENGTTLTLVTNMFYAPGVGLLRQDFESAAIRVFGFNIPIPAVGSVELTSYELKGY